MKWTMALFLVVLCYMAGVSVAAASRRRAELLGELEKELKLLGIRIVSRLETVESALSESGTELFVRISYYLREGEEVLNAWKRVCEENASKGKCADCLLDEELKLLNALFSKLGICSREEQCVEIDTCIARIECIRTAAQEQAMERKRLYPSVALLGGLALCIFVL